MAKKRSGSSKNRRPLTFRMTSETSKGDLRWTRSRSAFKVKSLLVVLALGLPGNVYVLHCYRTPKMNLDEDLSAFSQTMNETTRVNRTIDQQIFGDAISHQIESDSGQNITFQDVTSDLTQFEQTSNETFECYEDALAWEPTLYAVRYWVEGVALSIVGIVGLIGNFVSLLVLTTADKRSSFNTSLVILAVFDSFFLIFYVFDASYIDTFRMDVGLDPPWWYQRIFPHFLHPVKAMTMTTCIYMVVAVAANRHNAICNPMLYRPSARSSAVLVAAVAVVTNVPRFLEFQLVQDDALNVTDVTTTTLNEDPRYTLFVNYFELIVMGLLPLVALCYYNCAIYRRIRNSARMKGKHHLAGKRGGNKDENKNEACYVEEKRKRKGRKKRAKGERTLEEDNEGEDSNLTVVVVSNRTSSGSGNKSEVNGSRVQAGSSLRRQLLSASHAELHHHGTEGVGNGDASDAGDEMRKRRGKGRAAKLIRKLALNRSAPRSGDGNSPEEEEEEGAGTPEEEEEELSFKLDGIKVEEAEEEEVEGQDEEDSHKYHRHCHRSKSSCSANKKRLLNVKSSSMSRLRIRRGKGSAETKSTAILIGIILVFLTCHSLRFCHLLYRVLSDPSNHHHYSFCSARGRLHVPAAFFLAGNFNHLLLALNSSVNVLIYYCCGRRFRAGLKRLLRCRSCSFDYDGTLLSCLCSRLPQMATTQNKSQKTGVANPDVSVSIRERHELQLLKL